MFSCFTSCHEIFEKKVVSKLSKGNISQKYFDLYSLQNQLTYFSHKPFFWLRFFYSKALVVRKNSSSEEIPGLPSSGLNYHRLLLYKKRTHPFK